jgi:Protein of unknown function (DUF3830)
MTLIRIEAGEFELEAQTEDEKAPATTEWFLAQLPFHSQVIHARWSGEAVWIPLGDLRSGLDFENNTSYPSRGDILFYPAGVSETEILLAYGSASFASKAGALSGNHFLTITSGLERLGELGRHVLWHGAIDIDFDVVG